MRGELVIFGTAEIASLARYYFESDTSLKVRAFTVDDEYVEDSNFEGLPVVPFSEVTKTFPPEEYGMHVALSYNRLNLLRQEKYIQAKSVGYALPSYVCSKSVVWPDLEHGDNCFILENQTIQPGVRLGNNVMIWSGNHIGHGSEISDHTYIASHAVISGHCKIGQRCFIGVNATLRDFIRIGDDVFVTMDASVTKDVPNGGVVLGNAATILEIDDRRAQTIRRKYFRI